MKKKILFVINTLGRAGAERALLELMGAVDRQKYQVFLYILAGQGELIGEVPAGVKVLNRTVDETPVLSKEGLRHLMTRLFWRSLRKGALFYRLPYLLKNAVLLAKQHQFSLNKLTRRLLCDAADPLPQTFDLAVAYLEGGASFYVRDCVKAKKKAAFIHVDYQQAGYNRTLDDDCYLSFDRIFTVSKDVKTSFLQVYPMCADRTQVFLNVINRKRIEKKAKEASGFSDGYKGFRILTIGRLYAQKAFEVSIEAMRLLKEQGIKARWYVLGEGEERANLERQIAQAKLNKDFILLGAVENPYPYLAQTDLYVHASRFEGKSIAVQEAQVLGCPIIVSNCSGNREQVTDGVDGLFCELTAESICEQIIKLYQDEKLRKQLGQSAKERPLGTEGELQKLYDILEEGV